MRQWRACVSLLLLPLVAALGLAGCGAGGGTGDFEQRPAAGLRKTPFEPSLSVRFTRVELGYGHTCGLTADGRAFCMGDNEYGQLGTTQAMQRCKGGAFPCSPTPLLVDGALAFKDLGLDQRDSCGLTTDGSIYCWGFGEGGQLGDGLRTSSPVPVRTATDLRLRYLGQGQASNNLCAIS
jgi:alpha-tubulin suppressor-like RCC1 family protein